MDDNNITNNYNANKYEIISCSFHNWYDKFTKITMKSIIIQLPSSFIQYLNEDGIILPKSADNDIVDHLSDDDDIKEIDDNNNDKNIIDFPELISNINKSIEALGGEVFIKLNWSAPLDATWINNGSMKCCNAGDIVLLLKSSDRIVFDLEHMFDLCKNDNNCNDTVFKDILHNNMNNIHNDNIILVMRKWANLNPSMEFRIFVYNNKLVGMCQRDVTTFYEFLNNDKDDIQDLLHDFFHDNIKEKFVINSYCIDIYIDRKKRIWIVDFNPFGNPTDSLLFEWHELVNFSDESNFEMRTIESRNDCYTSSKGANRGPIDVTMAPDFYQFMKIAKEQAKNDDYESKG